ncbi:hypothetical protein ACFZBU_46490 [Embleya sp. NPDC008237]|uniref:hypothetical protein n=1 Tax=Embleya sp. NPDC008237 TaxID=3363978 RepID=UPI0036EF01BA
MRKLLVDPFTRAELGREGLEELSRNLWPGQCQTCGRELGEASPSVVVVEGVLDVTATLHHAGCERARWCRDGSPSWGRFLTTATCLTAVPFGDPGRDPFSPTLVVNPGLERVCLARDEAGRYRATTVSALGPEGFLAPSAGVGVGDGDTVASWLTGDRLIVRAGDTYWVVPASAADPLLREVRAFGGVVLGISTAIDPAAMGGVEPLKRILRSGDVALIGAPLADTPAPDVHGHTVRIESELAHADEEHPFDWIPEAPYPGPSYDPATGLFAAGLGMDGPTYWRLTVPGGGAANGLIAMPAGMGKTSMLRLIVLEALCSGAFRYLLIAPRGREGLIEVLGERAEFVADTPGRAVDLLARTARVVDVRLARAERHRVVDREHVGLLLAIDDGEDVLGDPAAAAAAAHVAIHGPGVGVGLVVASSSLAAGGFGGRRDLVVALGRSNAMVHTSEDLDELRRLQANA